MKTPPLLTLRPTQFVLGMKEIESKVDKLKSFNEKQLQKYKDDHIVPVVLGPHKQVYMIDHHHFVRACWETGIGEFQIDVIRDLRGKTDLEFWNTMVKKNWVYLHDQFGKGPHSPFALPVDIRCLADDPYRSLAWAMIDLEIVQKQLEPFFEFKWTAFFRLHLNIELHSKSDFREAIRQAKKLSRSKMAAHLPGYTPA